jgi:hypothetical protein
VCDQYVVSAKAMLSFLTEDKLAKILRRIDEISRQRDQENRQSSLIISSLLELLGGQAFLPNHALQNAPGFEAAEGEHSGDLVLRSLPKPATR